MRRAGRQWAHAARVATGATAVVAILAIAIAVITNLVIVHRLDHEVDARLTQRLEQAGTGASVPLVVSAGHDHDGDLDDAPTFVWRVTPTGKAESLTVGAPVLPHYDWSSRHATLTTDGSTFRFASSPSEGGWLVAGVSILKISQASGDLILAEVVLGALLLVVTFTGSFIVGLRASAPIEQIRRRQAEFTADASHELRTPLSVIEAEVDLALSRERDADSYRATLGRVASESGRLRSIVDDLLWLARHDGDVPASRSDAVTDVHAVARSCTQRFDVVAAAGSTTLRRPTEPVPVTPITADPEAIDRLVSVLVDNACRYAGSGGTVDVSVVQTGGRVTLAVDDSGPGIPADQRQLVLDRFHRADDTPGGTGLGLAIADAVVRSTEGTWSIGSSPLGGLRMEVSWRAAHEHRAGVDRRSTPDPPAMGPGLPTTASDVPS